MNYSSLNNARARVQAARDCIAEDDSAMRAIQDEIAILEARAAALKARQSAKGLHLELLQAERALAAAEEAAVEDINLHLAAEIMKAQANDPLTQHAWIAASVTKLHASVRSELDTPLGKKYAVHPLITQALSLLPPKDGIDRPVWDLGYQVEHVSDWASRRRQIIAEAEAAASPPLEAA
jgi:hypothetical protein